METKQKLIISFVALAMIFGGVLVYQNYQTDKLLRQHYTTLLKVTPAAVATQALGAQVYAESQDMINAKVPDINPFSVSVANAIDQTYKNPFQ